MKNNTNKKSVGLATCLLAVMAFVLPAASFAATLTVGQMATVITGSFGQLAQLITAGSYLAGLGFAVGAIMKFKAHKDSPTQVTIGAPIALVFVAAALLFLPTILAITGQTIFGSGGKVGGPTGVIFTNTGQ